MVWENEAERNPNGAGMKHFYEGLDESCGKPKQNGIKTEQERSTFMKDFCLPKINTLRKAGVTG